MIVAKHGVGGIFMLRGPLIEVKPVLDAAFRAQTSSPAADVGAHWHKYKYSMARVAVWLRMECLPLPR
jgi:hypothetical protein